MRNRHGEVLVLCLDIGGDADDACALVCAAHEPELALVVTSDEVGGERARLARHLLNLVGRSDVDIVAGIDLGNSRYWVADGLTPAEVPAQPANVVAAVRRVCAGTEGPLRWVGCSPLSELAQVWREAPDLRERLRVTQMGGGLDGFRDPTKAEHNVRLDPVSAGYVLDNVPDLTLVLSDTTFREEIAIYPGHPLYQAWAAPGAPAATRLLADHIDRWWDSFQRSSKQHDPLALTVALGYSFVELAYREIVMAPDGRMRLDPAGRRVRVSVGADYAAFLDWVTTRTTSHLLAEPQGLEEVS
ncbi:nucleoside hydrolase [Nocardia sp. NPDC003482]